MSSAVPQQAPMSDEEYREAMRAFYCSAARGAVVAVVLVILGGLAGWKLCERLTPPPIAANPTVAEAKPSNSVAPVISGQEPKPKPDFWETFGEIRDKRPDLAKILSDNEVRYICELVSTKGIDIDEAYRTMRANQFAIYYAQLPDSRTPRPNPSLFGRPPNNFTPGDFQEPIPKGEPGSGKLPPGWDPVTLPPVPPPTPPGDPRDPTPVNPAPVAPSLIDRQPPTPKG